MSVSDIMLVGWFHTLFCFVAMFAGARNLVAEKGTPAHRYAGQWYIAAMVLLNVSALVAELQPSHLVHGESRGASNGSAFRRGRRRGGVTTLLQRGG